MVFASDNVNTTDDGLLCTTSGDIGGVNEELMMEQSDINDEVASDFTDDISDVASESNNDDEILTSDNIDKEISDVESGDVLSSSNSNTLKMNNDNDFNKEILSSSNSEIIGISNDNDLLQSISVNSATQTSISGTISSTFTMDYAGSLNIHVYVQNTDYRWDAVEIGHKGRNTISIDFSISGSFTPGTYTLTYSISANRVYDSGITTCTVSKSTPTVTVSSKSITYNSGTYSVSGTCSVNGLTITLKQGSTTMGSTTVSDGKWTVKSISSTLFNPGSYTITATSTETTSYNSKSATNTLTVSKSTPTVTVSTKNVNYNTGTYTLGGTVKVGSNNVGTGTVTIYKDGVQIGTASVSSGSWTSSAISSTSYDAGSYTITASYASNTYYNSASGTGSLVISKVTPSITVDASTTIMYGINSYSIGGTAKAGQYNVDEGIVNLTCGSISLGTAIVSGGVWSVSNINPKLVNPSSNAYTITATYISNNNYYSNSATGSLTVNKFTPSITMAGSYYYNQANNPTLSGTVKLYEGDFYEGYISLYVNNVLLSDSVYVSSAGDWSYNLPSSISYNPGTYNVKVVWGGNDYTNPNNGTGDFLTVNKGMIAPVISVSPKNIDLGQSEYIAVDVMNLMGNGNVAGLTVVLTGNGIDGSLNNVSDSSGVAHFSVSGLDSGKYDDWKVSIIDNDYYSANGVRDVPTFYVQYPLNVFITNITPNNGTYPEEIMIEGYVNSGGVPQGNVSLTIGGMTYTVFFSDSYNFTASLIGVKPGVYTNITAKYNPTVDEFYYRGVESTVSIQ